MVPSPTSCDSGSGYCNAGVCTTTDDACATFGNMRFDLGECPMTSSQPCLVHCAVVGDAAAASAGQCDVQLCRMYARGRVPSYASVIAASRLGAAATFRAERSSAFAIAVSRTAAAGASRSMFCLISTRARSRALALCSAMRALK